MGLRISLPASSSIRSTTIETGGLPGAYQKIRDSEYGKQSHLARVFAVPRGNKREPSIISWWHRPPPLR